MKVLVVGLGSIGTRYARLLKEAGHDVTALRSQRGQLANELKIPELSSWTEVDRSTFDAVFIANPTHLHIETALEAARRGLPFLLEKPIDASLERLKELVSLVEEKKLTAYVAYPLRFHPVIAALRKKLEGKKVSHARAVCSSYLPDWRPGQDHLKTYSAHRAQGGGVILDLSHEFDYLEFLFGPVKKISGRAEKKSSVTVDAEDSCDAVLEFETGRADVHLDVVTKETRRTITVEGEDFSHTGDLVANRLDDEKFSLERDDLYRNQMEYFFSNRNNPRLMNNLSDASRLFEKLIHFRDASLGGLS